jgi:dCTP deaminase
VILPDFKIRQWAEAGGIDPFNPDHINPASIDLTIEQTYIDLTRDTKLFMGEGGLTLNIGQPILATTAEYIKLPGIYAGSVFLKSSLARQGLDHALAGWVDPGFKGQLTLELHAHRPVALVPGQRIVQLVLWVMQMEPDSIYNGRYQGQRGPTVARVEKAALK